MTCAFAVRGAIMKFSGVESVDVSLNKGLATVKLKPGAPVTAEQLWEAIKKSGYTPKETRVVVRGEILAAPGGIQLKVTGTDRTYELVPHAKSPKILEDAKLLAGKIVTIEGALTPEKDVTAPAPIRALSIKQ